MLNKLHSLSRAHIFIVLYAIAACFFLYVIENIYQPAYLFQAILKVLVFLLIPWAIAYFTGVTVGKLGKWTHKSLVYGGLLGLLSMWVIAGTYWILELSIDWNAIGVSMQSRGIDSTTFVLVFVYIMLGNSLLEEYFFRGIIFRILSNTSLIVAYCVSALAFALYHLSIFGTWFSGWILFLALGGLFLGGIFFAWLYRSTWGVWWAWIFHIFADLAILLIGYQKFFA
jgi:uncharacterized protein